MTTTTTTQNTIETPDVNLATYIKVVKGIDSVGHRLNERQLLIRFPITQEQYQVYKEEYLNSLFSYYDATKRNFLRLAK